MKRYKLLPDGVGMGVDILGAWIQFSDHEKAIAEKDATITALRAEVKVLGEAVWDNMRLKKEVVELEARVKTLEEALKKAAPSFYRCNCERLPQHSECRGNCSNTKMTEKIDKALSLSEGAKGE